MAVLPSEDAQETRARIIDAATELIAAGGLAALTTRAVAAAASVQAPTLYRLFVDKRGLLNAVAEHGMADFLARKTAAEPHPDPVQDLSDAWDAYVAFGLAHPAVFAIMNEVGARSPPSAAALAGIAVLRKRVERIARDGRLRLPVEQAVALIHAVGVGTVTTLLAAAADGGREARLAADARDAVLSSILAAPVADRDDGPRPLAIALGAHLDTAGTLTPGERLLLSELLTRIAEGPSTTGPARSA